MVEAATLFRKSGFNDSDAATLAKVAAQYQNVADTAVSAEDAAASIVSQIHAFGEDASFAQTVIDAYNEVANKFSVGTNDLSNAMEIAASGMATYGNEFSEIIGLVTAGTEIMTGRSAQVARGLSTIASRIVKNQDALAEYGITVENVDGSLKSTYDVLAELKPKWDAMTDAQRTALGDTIAGTNQYKVLASVMQNFEHATAATETALNSAGSAMKENERYMESLEAREQALKSEFEDFANRVLSKDLVNGFYDVAQAALEFINTDFGASLTRIAGVSTTVASTLGIIGTMGAKLVLVAKQLQNVGAATGLLGLLTTPKTVLIIGAVAAGIAGVYEALKAIDEKDEKKLENLSSNLQETQDAITTMTAEGSEYQTLLSNADKLTQSEQERLGVLQAQLDTLKEQSAEQEAAYLKEWQTQQTKTQQDWVMGQGVTETGETYTGYVWGDYTQSARDAENLRSAINNLNAEKRLGTVIDQEYISSLQDIIEEYQETYDTTIKVRDAGYELDDSQEYLVKVMEHQKEVISGLGAEYAQNSEDIQAFSDATDESASKLDTYIDALNEYRGVNEDAASSSEILVDSLFDSNGQLTEAAKQALTADGAMASMAQSFIEAQRAQAKADFSALILAIEQVGSAAAMTSAQISSMMALAGTPISGIDTEEGMARFKGYVKAQGYSDVQSYIKAVGQKNYQTKMEEYQKQLESIKSYVPSTGGGGGGSSSSKSNNEEVKKQTIKTIEELREYLTDEETRLKLIDPDIGKSDLESTLTEIATIYQSYQDYLSSLKQQGFDETSEQYKQAETEFAQLLAVLEQLFNEIAQKGNFTIEELYNKLQSALGDATDAIKDFASSATDSVSNINSAASGLISKIEDGSELMTLRVSQVFDAVRGGAATADDAITAIEDAWKVIDTMGDNAEAKFKSAVESALDNAEAEKKAAEELADKRSWENKLLEDKIKLEEKLEALEKAKQRRMLVYSEGRFQYMQDADAISSAQSDYQSTYRDVEQSQMQELLSMLGDENSSFFTSYFSNIDNMSADAIRGYGDALRNHLMSMLQGKTTGSVFESLSESELYNIFGGAMQTGSAYSQILRALDAKEAAAAARQEKKEALKKQIREDNVKNMGVDTDFGEKIKNATSQAEVEYWTKMRDTKLEMIKDYREAYGDEAASKYFGTDVSKMDTWKSNKDLYKEAYESGSSAWETSRDIFDTGDREYKYGGYTVENPDLKAAQYNAATAIDMEGLGNQVLYNRIFGGSITKSEIQDLYNKSTSDRSKGYLLNLASEMYKAGYSGYARGTKNASGGLSVVGENGPELRVLNSGDGIIPSSVTENLWRWGSMTPTDMLQSLVQKAQSMLQTLNISNVTLPNVHDAQSFVSGLREYAQQYITRRN